MSRQASQNVLVEINKLVGKGVIEYTEHEKGDFILPIFFRSKSDGTRRLILNLKTLNEFLEYKHFKTGRVHSLCRKSLHKALKILKFCLKADMFASNINYQLYTYFSYKAGLKAKAVDSFTVSWHFLKFCAFSSFAIIYKHQENQSRES